MTRALAGQIPILGLGQIPQLHSRPLVIDYFAGGGGVSEGVRLATGRGPDVAVNHDAHSIAMHAENHPGTLHLHTNVWDVDPVRDLPPGPVDLAWFSPDCRHFSRAKGGKPVERKVRGLAWIVLRVAARRRPAVIVVENVAEFRTWGPCRRGRPVRSKVGTTFLRFRAQLEALGYVIEDRILNAADHGAPTTRKRLFLVARCDGLPICWPEPSHGPGRARPYRTAASCIDFSLPCPSIFERKRPLAEATQRRIAEGLRRFVFECERPFIVGAVAPMLIQTGYGERKGQRPRSLDLHAPLGTVVAGGGRHALVCAWLAKHNGKTTGQPLAGPIHTLVGTGNKSLAALHLTKFYGTSVGSPLEDPAPTVTAQGQHTGLVAAFLTKYYGTSSTGASLSEPLHTIVAKARFGLVTVLVDGESYALTDIGMRMLTPRELASCQGFDASYRLTGTQAQQIARVGNSVPPPLAAAIVAANVRPLKEEEAA